MSLSDLNSRQAVLDAIRECKKMGRDKFLEHYGFKRSRSYFLNYEGEDFDSKAIVAVAHRFQFPAKGSLKAHEFSGGKSTVKPKLESLSFTVKVSRI